MVALHAHAGESACLHSSVKGCQESGLGPAGMDEELQRVCGDEAVIRAGSGAELLAGSI